MTMYTEMTYSQRLGLTPEAAEELKNDTLAELTEMGFVNLPKPTSGETCDEMCEQVDDGKVDADVIFEAVMDNFAGEVCKENYEDFEERWLEEQVAALFPNE